MMTIDDLEKYLWALKLFLQTSLTQIILLDNSQGDYRCNAPGGRWDCVILLIAPQFRNEFKDIEQFLSIQWVNFKIETSKTQIVTKNIIFTVLPNIFFVKINELLTQIYNFLLNSYRRIQVFEMSLMTGMRGRKTRKMRLVFKLRDSKF